MYIHIYIYIYYVHYIYAQKLNFLHCNYFYSHSIDAIYFAQKVLESFNIERPSPVEYYFA